MGSAVSYDGKLGANRQAGSLDGEGKRLATKIYRHVAK